jgi:hypothetical protein
VTWPRKPTAGGAGRIEVCIELINRARECLEDLDKQCAARLIEELIRNQCHDGRLVGGETADEVRDVVHAFWKIANYVEEGELLSLLRKLNVSRTWMVHALRKRPREIQWYLRRYGLR